MASDPLAQPLTLPCGQVLPNRLMKSALSETLGDRDGAPTPALLSLYERWGGGGYGLVVTGNIMVDSRHRGEPGNVVVEDDRHLAGLSRWAKAFQNRAEAPLWGQINHPGRQAMNFANKTRPVAPSAVKANIPMIASTPRELRGEEIEDILDRYATTAAVLEAAGFHGVQLHAAHGYLITQFLSPLANKRTDEWGGDPQRRQRFLIEAVRRVRSRVSPSFGVGVKLNSADFQRGGFSEEESREVVRALSSESLDLIEISGGNYESPAMVGQAKTAAASTVAREAYFLEYAKTVREHAGSVPLAVTGGFRSKAAMAEAVSSGAVDVVGLGRPAVSEPEAGNALLTGGAQRLGSYGARAGLRPLVGKVTDLKQLDSVLDLQWHTQQLRRIGEGKEPKLSQSWWETIVTMMLTLGPKAFQVRRGR
ncbi:NADH:flavin oxidoreductase/NADH oxidase [Segniliparus rotundus DSM 44985]|uniref:NADH:flavin oxidoreductase/NADH oxidase n=1 Tax=Segniliparus rotundus (strain ATCC BAA-972 / CDC 1076 / CIP 108378 / DSM 44985 / JCM 13578) TaxID=640132 RepID=D6ZEC4_SEGRD|nr:NADH:flavin oxidoreductase/NADH oxidase family protein [Segniliparus rotundus]ADG99400.1 NADH:flavin oxidoreductase/NADH oxidase [Segniliparus rotundus DSM 44985]